MAGVRRSWPWERVCPRTRKSLLRRHRQWAARRTWTYLRLQRRYRSGTCMDTLAWVADHDRNMTHRVASSFTRRMSSSLYSSATRLEYFFLTSESLSKEAPPCRVKNSVAEPLPPTFIVRSWTSCQLSRLVELENCGVRGHATCEGWGRTHRTKEMCTPILRCTLEQSRQMYKPNVTLAQVGLRAWQSKHI